MAGTSGETAHPFPHGSVGRTVGNLPISASPARGCKGPS